MQTCIIKCNIRMGELVYIYELRPAVSLTEDHMLDMKILTADRPESDDKDNHSLLRIEIISIRNDV